MRCFSLTCFQTCESISVKIPTPSTASTRHDGVVLALATTVYAAQMILTQRVTTGRIIRGKLNAYISSSTRTAHRGMATLRSHGLLAHLLHLCQGKRVLRAWAIAQWGRKCNLRQTHVTMPMHAIVVPQSMALKRGKSSGSAPVQATHKFADPVAGRGTFIGKPCAQGRRGSTIQSSSES